MSTKRSKQEHWKNVGPITGIIPCKWMQDCVFSSDLLPFACRTNLTRAIIPVDSDGNLECSPAINSLWKKAEALWKKHRTKGKSNPSTLLQRINHHSQLSKQLPVAQPKVNSQRSVVIYNASGSYLRASRQKGSEVVDSGCYWWQARSAAESKYLVAILNSGYLQPAFQFARQSDRHFHLHIWDTVPIPQFDSSINIHKDLAKQCSLAETVISSCPQILSSSSGQQKISDSIRRLLQEEGIMQKIDDLAAQLIKID